MSDSFLTRFYLRIEQAKATMQTMTKPKTVSEQLRAAILTADVSRYRISQKTGVAQSDLSRFVHRQQGLSLDTIDQLAEYLNLELRERSTPRKGK